MTAEATADLVFEDPPRVCPVCQTEDDWHIPGGNLCTEILEGRLW